MFSDGTGPFGKIHATLLTRYKPRRAVIYSRDELLLGLTPFLR